MLGRKIMQGLIIILCFLGWDFYFKDAFYGWVLGEGEVPGLAEIALGYGLVFIIAFVLSTLLYRSLGLSEGETESSGVYEY